METRMQRVLAMVSTLAAASCTSLSTSQSGAGVVATGEMQAGTAMCPAGPPAPQCVVLRDTSSNTCEMRGGKTICPVQVGVTTAGLFVYPYTLNVPRGAPNVHVVWTVIDSGLWFKDIKDGPCFSTAHSNGKFKEGQPTHDPDGGNGDGRSAKRFRVKFDAAGAAASHTYTIQVTFKNPTGPDVVMRCDPLINNSAG